MRSAWESNSCRRGLAVRLGLGEGGLKRTGVETHADILVGLGDGKSLTILVEVDQRVHGQRLLVLHHRTGGIEMDLRPQDVATVDAAIGRTERHIVPRRAPARLLFDRHVWDAVFGEEALLLGNDQRRRVGERDKAEFGAGNFRGRSFSHRTAGEERPRRKQRRGCGRGTLEEGAAGGRGQAHSTSPIRHQKQKAANGHGAGRLTRRISWQPCHVRTPVIGRRCHEPSWEELIQQLAMQVACQLLVSIFIASRSETYGEDAGWTD